jgi:hypothetical protein
MEKHSVSRLSYLFAHLHLLSSDLFSSDSSHLCFSTVQIVGSFTSKLPSMIIHPQHYGHYLVFYDYFIHIPVTSPFIEGKTQGTSPEHSCALTMKVNPEASMAQACGAVRSALPQLGCCRAMSQEWCEW